MKKKMKMKKGWKGWVEVLFFFSKSLAAFLCSPRLAMSLVSRDPGAVKSPYLSTEEVTVRRLLHHAISNQLFEVNQVLLPVAAE